MCVNGQEKVTDSRRRARLSYFSSAAQKAVLPLSFKFWGGGHAYGAGA